MSTINCDACNELREYAPEFVQNGVTTNVATSLKNDTGFNSSLTVAHTDCEDLNDANDCLIGRLDQEIEAYEVCDWKTYMHKLLPNLYELLKAIIAAICGLWTNVHNLWSKVTSLCTSVDRLLALIQGGLPAAHAGTWTEEGYAALAPSYDWEDKEKFYPALLCDILEGFGCTTGRRLGRWSFRINYSENVWPLDPSYLMEDFHVGDIWAYWNKADIVPQYMTEERWTAMMTGRNTMFLSSFGNYSCYVSYRGYIVINDIEFNTDLKERFGEDVIVVEVRHVIGAGSSSGPFTGLGDVVPQVQSYNA